MSPVLFRDAEAVVQDALADAMGGVVVAGRVPNPRPTEFIRIERLGGTRETRVTDASRIAVEAWAGTDAEAAQLLNTARSHLFDLESTMFGVEEYGGPVRLPDPTTNMSRYTASFVIRIRPLP